MREDVNGILFFSDFDSGNLAKVEEVPVQSFSSSGLSLGLGLSDSNHGNLQCVGNRPKSACSLGIKNGNGAGNSFDTISKNISNSFTRSSESPNSLRNQNASSYSSLLFAQATIDLDLVYETLYINHRKPSIHGDLDREFNLWTRNDCSGTPFENVNRTWFYFGVKLSTTDIKIRFNIMNLNQQKKLMSQGMTPVYKIGSGKWRRIPHKPTFYDVENNFVISFHHSFGDTNECTFFAFTYPFSYSDCQDLLVHFDQKFSNGIFLPSGSFTSERRIYYSRELVCQSNKELRLDLLTISSCKGITTDREKRLPHLFPDPSMPTSYKFKGKKVVFLSSRVHPGETQSSFVLNGFLQFILSESDPRASLLRDQFVFKIIPMQNPDGVYHGHYRTDLNGVNLNRTYLNCKPEAQPTIYATRTLLLYYHWEYANVHMNEPTVEILQKFNEQLEKEVDLNEDDVSDFDCNTVKCGVGIRKAWNKHKKRREKLKPWQDPRYFLSPSDSGVAYFIDLHGHASKRGCFLFGNYFNSIVDKVDCMLLAKLMSINFAHFDLTACNFSAQNMIQKGLRDRLSKEGSGRVSMYYLTKIIHSYTFECNFNSGRMVNVLPPILSDGASIKSLFSNATPPKYTPKIFEEAGEALAVSILDACEVKNPLSRLPLSSYQDLEGVRDWLMQYLTGGKTVSAWRHPRIQHWNAFKKVSVTTETQTTPSKKSTRVRESPKSGKLTSVKSQRKATSALTKLSAVKKLSKPEISIHISQPDEERQFHLLVPEESVSSIYSAKSPVTHVKKNRRGSAVMGIRKESSSPVSRGIKMREACNVVNEEQTRTPDLYIFGTVCQQLASSRKIRPRSVNM